LRNPQRPALKIKVAALKIKVAFRQTSTAPAICRAFLAAMSADQPTAAEAQCSWSSKKIITNDAASFQSFSCSVARHRRMFNSAVNLTLNAEIAEVFAEGDSHFFFAASDFLGDFA